MSKKNKKVIDPNILQDSNAPVEEVVEETDAAETVEEVTEEVTNDEEIVETAPVVEEVVKEDIADPVSEEVIEPVVETVTEVKEEVVASPVKKADPWFGYILVVQDKYISLEQLAEKIKANRKANIKEVVIDEEKNWVVIFNTDDFNTAVKQRKLFLGYGIKSTIVEIPVD